ncbi:MAG: MFS transporter [candidate division WOR-3 bacterium]
MSPYIVQLLANAGLTAAVVYIPLLATKMGANSSQIGLLVGTYQGMMFLASLVFGRWADFGDRKRFVVFGLLASAVALGTHLLVRNLYGLFVVRFLAGMCAGIFPAALVAYFYEENQKLGRFTGFGSLGWAIGAIVVGLVAVNSIFMVAAILLGITSGIALFGLRPQRVKMREPFLNLSVFKRNWRLYLSFLLRHLGAFSIWTIFPVYLAHLGASRFWVGVVYALNPLGQFVFMNLLERSRETTLIRAGLFLSILVFVAFGLANDFRQVIPIQIVLALSWSCLYLGSLKQLLRTNPERSTAAGMLQSVLSLAAVLGAFLEGVTGAFGYRVIMFVAAGLALAGTILYISEPPLNQGEDL